MTRTGDREIVVVSGRVGMYEWIEHPPGIREVTGSNPVGDSDFFFIPRL